MIKLVQRAQRPHSPNQQGIIIRATKLARRGKYQQAENLLASLPADQAQTPSVLDLRARVYAQQGHLLAAERCWHEALKLSPGNASYRQALRCLSEYGRLPGSTRPFLVLAIALVLLVTMFAVIDLRSKQAEMLRRLDQIMARTPTTMGQTMVSPTQPVARVPSTAPSTATQPSR